MIILLRYHKGEPVSEPNPPRIYTPASGISAYELGNIVAQYSPYNSQHLCKRSIDVLITNGLVIENGTVKMQYRKRVPAYFGGIAYGPVNRRWKVYILSTNGISYAENLLKEKENMISEWSHILKYEY